MLPMRMPSRAADHVRHRTHGALRALSPPRSRRCRAPCVRATTRSAGSLRPFVHRHIHAPFSRTTGPELWCPWQNVITFWERRRRHRGPRPSPRSFTALFSRETTETPWFHMKQRVLPFHVKRKSTMFHVKHGVLVVSHETTEAVVRFHVNEDFSGVAAGAPGRRDQGR